MSVTMASNALRQLLCRKAAPAASSNLGKPGRSFHASAPTQLEYSNDYIHAPTMYNLTKMKGRKLKFGILVFGGVAAGTLVPILAVCFQQSKAAAGGGKEEGKH
ncbi:unnamed protein product [Calypogeia fissa]